MTATRSPRVAPRRACGGVARGLAAAAMALGTAAHAAPLWELGIGAGMLRLPHYRGSDQSHLWLLPVPYVAYRGTIFKADRDGARAVLFDSPDLELDLSASASAPTRSRDSHAREGMPDLAPTGELGPNLNWTLARGGNWKLDLRVPVRAALTLESRPRMVGWISHPHFNLDVQSVGGWNLGLLAGPVYGSRRQHAYFYDVAPEYARADRPVFHSAGGAAGFSAIAALSRRDGDRWTGLFVKADSLSGAAFEASPLVRRHQHVAFGAALSWVFAASSRPAPAPAND